MNYGICSNGSRDTGYETAVRTAGIISSLGATPVFEAGMDEECPKLKEVPGVVFADFAKTDIKAVISIGGDGTFLSKVTGTLIRSLSGSISALSVSLMRSC